MAGMNGRLRGLYNDVSYIIMTSILLDCLGLLTCLLVDSAVWTIVVLHLRPRIYVHPWGRSASWKQERSLEQIRCLRNRLEDTYNAWDLLRVRLEKNVNAFVNLWFVIWPTLWLELRRRSKCLLPFVKRNHILMSNTWKLHYMRRSLSGYGRLKPLFRKKKVVFSVKYLRSGVRCAYASIRWVGLLGITHTS